MKYSYYPEKLTRTMHEHGLIMDEEKDDVLNYLRQSNLRGAKI